MTSATLPTGTGIVSSYAYNNADRLTGMTHVKDGSTTIASVAYTLDSVGNRTQRVDQAGTHSYAYDNLYRLTSVTYPGPSTTTYAFDAFGNRTSKTEPGSQTTTYGYNDGERLTSVTPPSPAPAVNYTWDNNGDLTARGSDSFAWDYEDRMTSATVGGTTTTFAYRGDGLRDSRTTGGNTTTFTWDVNAALPVVLDDGAQYLYGAGLDAMKRSGAWYYYLADGLGSTMAIVDSAGAVQKSYTYDVYGKPTATGSLANEFDFAGQQTDPTGLQYLRARYMDPETGRFISREPLEAVPGWGGNPFGYGAGNPARRIDPSGLYPCDDPDCTRQPGWQPVKPPLVPNGGPDFPDGNVPNFGDVSVCDGLDYYHYDHCREKVPLGDWRDDYSNAIVTVVRPLIGEYHDDLRECVQDPECRALGDTIFDTINSSGTSGLDQAAIEAAYASPWPFLAGIYVWGKRISGIPLSQVWSAYRHKYGR